MGKAQQFWRSVLGTFKIIRDLLKQTFGIELSKRSLSHLLGQLGRLKRPIFKAAAQDLEAVEKYLKQRYSETRAQAQEIGAEIFSCKRRPFAFVAPTIIPGRALIDQRPELKEHRRHLNYNASVEECIFTECWVNYELSSKQTMWPQYRLKLVTLQK